MAQAGLRIESGRGLWLGQALVGRRALLEVQCSRALAALCRAPHRQPPLRFRFLRPFSADLPHKTRAHMCQWMHLLAQMRVLRIRSDSCPLVLFPPGPFLLASLSAPKRPCIVLQGSRRKRKPVVGLLQLRHPRSWSMIREQQGACCMHIRHQHHT